jgi:hypothetical protein
MKIIPTTENVFNDIFDRAFFEYTKKRFLADDELDDFKKCFFESMRSSLSKQDFNENDGIVSIDFIIR